MRIVIVSVPILQVLALAALLGTGGVRAQEDPWYSGISAGFIDAGSSLGFRGVLPGLAMPGAGSAEPFTSQTQFGGYRVSNAISIEGAQTSYGGGNSGCTGEAAAGEAPRSCYGSALSLAGVAKVPFESGLSLYGRLGLHYWQNGPHEDQMGPARRLDDLGGVMGVGLSYEYSKRVTFHAESEHYSDLSGSHSSGPGSNLGLDASVHSIGLSIKF
jgi:hypothetical protein